MNLWIIPLLPLTGAAINGLLGKRFPKALVNTIALGSTALAFAYALWVAAQFFGLPPDQIPHVEHYTTWLASGSFSVEYGMYLDQLSLVMLLIVTGVGFVIHIFSVGYMAHEAQPVPLPTQPALAEPGAYPGLATSPPTRLWHARRRRGEPVLPLAFGEAGLPVTRRCGSVAGAAGLNSLGPGRGPARAAGGGGRLLGRGAAAHRRPARGLRAGQQGPAVRADGRHRRGVAVTRPSWVSYAAQAALSGRGPFVDIRPGAAGVPDPAHLGRAVRRPGGGPPSVPSSRRSPTTRPAPGPCRGRPDLVPAAEAHDLVIISDEIYRDLVHDPAAPFTVPPSITSRTDGRPPPQSKNLALGGGASAWPWLPAGTGSGGPARPAARHRQRDLVRSGRAGAAGRRARVQRAAALTERVALSRRLHGSVARAVALRFAAAGAAGPAPQAAFYLYPDFSPLADVLLGGTASPATRAWRRCCCTSTAWGCCRAARSARTAGGCGCGWPRPCSTATPTPSATPR